MQHKMKLNMNVLVCGLLVRCSVFVRVTPSCQPETNNMNILYTKMSPVNLIRIPSLSNNNENTLFIYSIYLAPLEKTFGKSSAWNVFFCICICFWSGMLPAPLSI